MMKGKHFTNTEIAAALVTALAVMPAAHAARNGATAPGPDFTRMDANHDGYISLGEARRHADFDKALREADDNHDGRLDATEFVKAESVYSRMHAVQYIDDSLITAKVKAALLKDGQVSGLDVSVETYKGTVLLSGFVRNPHQAQRAAEIASGVRGVTAVKNDLLVKS